MSLHNLSVKRPVTVIMAVLVFVVLGAFSLMQLPMEMTPDISLNVISVITTYQNVAPSEIETLVTDPIEDAASAVSGVDSISSVSNEGMSFVMISFSGGTDIDEAKQDIKEKLDLIRLPEDCSDPMIMKMDASMMPVAMLSFTREGYSLEDTQKFLEDNVKTRLEAIDGVASVDIQGATEREIHVEIDTNKMFGYNISMNQIVAAIAQENNNMPGGSVTSSGKDVTVRSIGKFKSLKEISSIPITTPTGQIIYLDDVAAIKDSSSEISSISRIDGEGALAISMQKQSGANTVEVIDRITKVLDSVTKQYEGCRYDFTFEQGSYIENALGSVAQSAVIGCILAILILFLFLGSMKSSLIIGITMPVSILTTFIAMYFAGMSINIVSLGGLSLGVGMLVDNAIVVLENIFRRRQDLRDDGITAAIKGAGEVVGAVVASVLTTCIVYVPMLFLDNMMMDMFKEFAFVIIFSQCASLLVTFLLIPMLSSKIESIESTGTRSEKITKPFRNALSRLSALYEKLVRAALGNRKKVLALAMSLLVLSFVILGSLGMELMASGDEGQITVTAEFPLGTPLETADAFSREIEDIATENKNVQTVFSSISGGGGMMSLSSGTSSTIYLTLAENRRDTTDEVVEQMRIALADMVGAELSIEASSTTNMSMGSSSGVEFNFVGDDIDTLSAYAEQAAEVLRSVDGTREVKTSLAETKTEARIYLDREKTARYGLTTQAASSLIYTAVSGTTASTYTENGSEYDIVVKFPEKYTETYDSLRNIRLKAGTGQWITIGDIGKISLEEGYNSIEHQDKKRIVSVSAQLYGRDMNSVAREFNRKMSDIPAPEGCSMQTGGSMETLTEAVSSILLAILIGILLMYMVMAAQFESYSQPLIIMASLPMCLVGVALSLLVDGEPVNMMSLIGMLMLVGMIVNNAIVLIEFINDLKRENPEMSRTEIVVKACLTRLRPILMTTLTSILGFMPMVLSTAEGSEMMRPLAVTLLGGLGFGTLLTLVFVPVVYTYFDDLNKKRIKKRELKKATV